MIPFSTTHAQKGLKINRLYYKNPCLAQHQGGLPERAVRRGALKCEKLVLRRRFMLANVGHRPCTVSLTLTVYYRILPLTVYYRVPEAMLGSRASYTRARIRLTKQHESAATHANCFDNHHSRLLSRLVTMGVLYTDGCVVDRGSFPTAERAEEEDERLELDGSTADAGGDEIWASQSFRRRRDLVPDLLESFSAIC
jgi:hypothetical protein